MSNLLRRSWSNRGGADPSTWELPVNQASKWLVPKSGSYRILGEGGSVALVNNDSRRFLLSVFVGDGGTVNVGGTSGANTIRISRSGSTITVTAQPNSGSAVTKTATTDMPANRWANVYLKASVSGGLNNQITITYQVDFKTGVSLLATGDLFGNSLTTGGKTLTCNSLSGWAWFGSTTGGFFGWGGTSNVPIDDAKYREAVINNATWDIDNQTTMHTWNYPDAVRYLRAWLIQGGGGTGGQGFSGSPGTAGRAGSSGSNAQPDMCTAGTDGTDGTAGTSGSAGGKGGNNGANGTSGGSGGPGGRGGSGGSPSFNRQGTEITSCSGGYAGSAGAAGSAGSGGDGGAGGRGKMIQLTTAQRTIDFKAGVRGAVGSPGGGTGGDGKHTEFAGVTTADATALSTPSLKFGVTEFAHGLGGSDQDGGVVFYLQW